MALRVRVCLGYRPLADGDITNFIAINTAPSLNGHDPRRIRAGMCDIVPNWSGGFSSPIYGILQTQSREILMPRPTRSNIQLHL
jgi:hypothetical protein